MGEQMYPIIKINHVSKQYKLGTIGGTTLRDEIQRKFAKIKNEDDPTLMIGDTKSENSELFWALNDINLSISKGEAVGIIGHNGAGKSTLLKLLCQITAPTYGEICYDGRIASMLEVGTGFHPELTGRENIYLNGAILGMSRSEIDKKIDEIIDFSECRQFIDTPVKRYSSGMYVKLAFSVAAHLDSEIMIMDEVLAVGDMAFQKKCLDKMRDEVINSYKTVLYVSHNMNTIKQLCNRCILLNKGKVVFDGEVDEAIEKYMGIVNDSPALIDLTDHKPTQSVQDGVKIESIEVLNSNSWRIHVGEKLKFLMTVKSSKELENVGFRARLSSADNTSISVLLAPDLFSCKENESIRIIMEADISSIVPGRYCLTPVLYGVNEYGGWQFYDHIEQAITFEVESIAGFNQDMNWDSRWWGYVKLPNVKCLIEERQ